MNSNTLANNDVGVYFTNLRQDGSAPASATNYKAVNNTISDDQCFNASYQAGISDVGNNDKLINNTISGPGYVGCSNLYNPTGTAVDADAWFANRPKVHAQQLDGRCAGSVHRSRLGANGTSSDLCRVPFPVAPFSVLV